MPANLCSIIGVVSFAPMGRAWDLSSLSIFPSKTQRARRAVRKIRILVRALMQPWEFRRAG